MKLPVNRCEPHISDLIKRRELLYDHLSNVLGGNFAVIFFMYSPLNFTRNFFNLINANRPFFAGLNEPRYNLFSVKRLSSRVSFNNHKRNMLNIFIRCKAPLALQAFSSSANGIAIAPGSRINYLWFHTITRRAFHVQLLPKLTELCVKLGSFYL